MEIISLLEILLLLVSALFLIAILGYSIKNKKINSFLIKSGILSIIILFLLLGLSSTVETYNLWKQDPISQYLFPPYAPWSYFAGYAFFHFWFANTLLMAVSAIWTVFLLFLSKQSKERLLDRNEAYLGFFTALTAGWPGFPVYFALVFLIMLSQQILNIIILKNRKPAIIAHSLILSAIITLFLGDYLIDKLGLTVLKI